MLELIWNIWMRKLRLRMLKTHHQTFMDKVVVMGPIQPNPYLLLRTCRSLTILYIPSVSVEWRSSLLHEQAQAGVRDGRTSSWQRSHPWLATSARQPRSESQLTDQKALCHFKPRV